MPDIFASQPDILVSHVVAVDRNGLIGANGGLPWPRLPGDLAWFKDVTMGKPIVMGRRTWDSIGRRRLPGRFNIVVSRTVMRMDCRAGDGIVCPDVLSAMDFARRATGYMDASEVVVIGGAEIFAATAEACRRIYLTEVAGEFTGDVYYPGGNPTARNGWVSMLGRRICADSKNPHAMTFRILERNTTIATPKHKESR